LAELKDRLGEAYPRVLVILGNDDPRHEVESLEGLAAEGLLDPLHMRGADVGGFHVYGYACVPPTPFGLKDWERWDVSRHLEPGCMSPEEGFRSVPAKASDVRYGTIAKDLAALVRGAELGRAVMLFHAPPHETNLDRAALDGVIVEHVPLDVHVGSIAIRRFIEERQPLVTLHGHVHESVRLDGRPGVLEHELEHYAYRDLKDHLETMGRYADLAARQMREEGKRATFWGLACHPPLAWLRNYVLRLGFRDGVPGLIVSGLNACYVFLKLAKLWELQRSAFAPPALRRDEAASGPNPGPRPPASGP